MSLGNHTSFFFDRNLKTSPWFKRCLITLTIEWILYSIKLYHVPKEKIDCEGLSLRIRRASLDTPGERRVTCCVGLPVCLRPVLGKHKEATRCGTRFRH